MPNKTPILYDKTHSWVGIALNLLINKQGFLCQLSLIINNFLEVSK